MDTFDDAVEQLTSAQAGGFDYSAGSKQPATLIQEGIAALAADSHWIKAQPNLGPTVADQAEYVLAEKIVKLFALEIANAPYQRRDVRELWDLRAGRDQIIGSEGGVFAETFAEDGKTKSFALLPVPTEDGLEIIGLASITPDPLSGTDPLPFPPKYRRAILDYAKSIAYEDLDENVNAGATYLARAERRAEQLFLFANSRTGSGPWKIPIAGKHRG